MEPLDVFASAPHFVAHLSPVVEALEPNERGRFHLTTWARRGAFGTDIPWSLRPVDRNKCAPILIASWGDVPKIGGRPFVMVEHGAGQAYSPAPHPDTTPDYAHMCGLVLILVPNPIVGFRNELHHPHATVAVVGSARVDRLRKIREEFSGNPRLARPIPVYNGRETSESPGLSTDTTLPTVAFTWHWSPKGSGLPKEAASAFPHWRSAVAQLAAMDDDARGFRMLGTAHPRALAELRVFYKRSGVECVPDFDEVIRRADCVVFDNSSAGWESVACGVPVVLLGAPWYRTSHGLRFFDCADAGIEVRSGRATELREAILTTLADDPCHARREAVALEVYGLADGMAAQRSADAIRNVLAQ